ncbi:MAG: SGNH/GDSL hydrolase family protein [Propionibacteriaceae bacterium]|nr:SGNH/GDSL hydrolase family protein [Propionibacteriaceae bacterium]
MAQVAMIMTTIMMTLSVIFGGLSLWNRQPAQPAQPTTTQPTAAPTTVKPTTAPTTAKPTTAPTTAAPTTPAPALPTATVPTQAPTTAQPTQAPTTATPTPAPTTTQPTQAPTTQAPQPQPQPAQGLTMVALGDSYSSGAGVAISLGSHSGYWWEADQAADPTFAGQFENVTINTTESGITTISRPCQRNDLSWPVLLADQLGAELVDFRACSGARAEHFTQPQDGKTFEAQLNGFVGYNGTAKIYNPDIVTLSIGGNDLGFAELAAQCAFGDCNAAVQTVRTRIPALQTELVQTYQQVLNAAPNAQVYIVAYPSMAPAEGTQMCGMFPAVAPQIREMTSLLNNAIAASVDIVDDARLQFITVDFGPGHDMCAADTYFTGTGLASLLSGSALHPNAAGNQAYANSVAATLRS